MFKSILKKHWALLSPAIQSHYSLDDGEEITMQGELAVKHGAFIKLLMPLIRLTGALVPVEGEGFCVTVKNNRKGNKYYWQRKFEKDNKVYAFNSIMQQYGDSIVEFVGLGVGIRMGLQVENNKLVYNDRGYVIKFGKMLIPIPLHLLMGRAVIEEFEAENSLHDIDMRFVVVHPLFGFAFSYMGYFDFDRKL